MHRQWRDDADSNPGNIFDGATYFASRAVEELVHLVLYASTATASAAGAAVGGRTSRTAVRAAAAALAYDHLYIGEHEYQPGASYAGEDL